MIFHDSFTKNARNLAFAKEQLSSTKKITVSRLNIPGSDTEKSCDLREITEPFLTQPSSLVK